jgi:DNA-binding response OmpR family regulator
MPGVEVALLHWPRDRAERDRLGVAMLPRLLLVPDGQRPPPTAGDPMEDWIRVPADERDVAARLRTLADRATTSLDEAVVVDGHCLRRAAVTIPLSPSEATFISVLVTAGGRVVPRGALAHAIWPGGAPHPSRALDDLAYRLRRRIGVVGLDVVTARGRGFALQQLSSAMVAPVE